MSRTGTAAERRRSRRIIPFWILQAAGLLALVALADLSLHVGHGGTLVGAGAVYALLAVTADGPLGLLHLCNRRLHVLLVVVVSVVVALSPLVPVLRPDIEGIIILEVIAVGMLRLATLTNTAPPRPRPVEGGGPVIEVTATPVTATPVTDAPAPAPEPVTTTGAAARWAGRTAAAASAAASQHRPAAEEQVLRAIRNAGRLTGKATTGRHRQDPDPT